FRRVLFRSASVLSYVGLSALLERGLHGYWFAGRDCHSGDWNSYFRFRPSRRGAKLTAPHRRRPESKHGTRYMMLGSQSTSEGNSVSIAIAMTSITTNGRAPQIISLMWRSGARSEEHTSELQS